MDCIRILTALVIVTDGASWTDPFNWHFLPKHYRLHSNHTIDHTVRFDTDCGTLAADNGATHFLWDPESGLCSVSSGLTAADFSAANQQDSKTSFYYVRDFALVAPPGSPNCPTEKQLKRMIDNLKSMKGSFATKPDPNRRTWRDECKKNESADAKDATTTASAGTSTSNPTTSANVAPVSGPGTTTDITSTRTASSTVDISLAETGSTSTSPVISTQSTTLSGRTFAAPPAAAGAAPLPMTDTASSVSDSILTHTPFRSAAGAKTTSFEETDTTMERDSVTPMSTNTPLVMTVPNTPTDAATASRSKTDDHNRVPSGTARSPFKSDTSTETTPLVATDTTTDEVSFPTTPSTPSGMTVTDSPTAAATPSRSTIDTSSPVSSFITHSPFAFVTSTETAISTEDSTIKTYKATMTSPTVAGRVSTMTYTTVGETTSTSTMHSDTITSSSPTAHFTRGLTIGEQTTGASGSDTAHEQMSPSSVSGTHSSTTSSSNPATNFTRFMADAWETKTKSDPISTLSPAKSSPVTAAPASRTSSVSKQESTKISSDTMITNTTKSAILPFSTNVTATGSVVTTVPNRKTTGRAITASRTMKVPWTTKRHTTKWASTKRLTTKTAMATTKRPTTKRPTTKRPTTKRPTTKRPTTKRRTTKRTTARPKPPPVRIPEKSTKAVPLYKAYRAAGVYDYIYTTNYNEARKTPGYNYDGIADRILRDRAPNSVPLYRLYNVARKAHFYTVFPKGRTEALSKGAKDQGIAGYVYPTSSDKKSCPYAQVRPLYRLVKYAPTARYFYTMDPAEKARAVRERSYKYEEIAACIYPSK